MPDTFVCEGESFKVELPNQINTMYLWKDKTNDTTTTFIGWRRILEPVKNTAIRIERVKKTGTSVCRIIDTFQLDVKPKPTVSISPDSIFTCAGNVVEFIANMAGGHWTGPGVSSSAQNLSFITNEAYLGKNEVIYNYTSPFGCSNADTSILSILESPKAQFSKNDSIVKVGDTRVFKSAFIKRQNHVLNWETTNPDSVILDQDSIVIKFNQMGESTIALFVFDSMSNCGDTARIEITVKEHVSLNNSLATNFIIYPNPSNGTLTISSFHEGILEIYNLNGVLVFSNSIDLKPQAINIERLNQGVYYYFFTSKIGSVKGKLLRL